VPARSTFVWGPYEKPVINGDSLVAGGISGPGGGPSIPWRQPMFDIITRTFTVRAGCRYADAGMPLTYVANGASGTLMDYWSTNAATLVLGHGYTICFVAWGVNDASGAVSPATTGGRLITGVQAVWASEPGMRMVVVGAMNNGEQWPDGGNAADANIDATNYGTGGIRDACDTLSASGTITFLDPRAWWFGPTGIKVPNPGNGGAVYVWTVDNLHLNYPGALATANELWSHRAAA
jgi:hypothetical protein